MAVLVAADDLSEAEDEEARPTTTKRVRDASHFAITCGLEGSTSNLDTSSPQHEVPFPLQQNDVSLPVTLLQEVRSAPLFVVPGM